MSIDSISSQEKKATLSPGKDVTDPSLPGKAGTGTGTRKHYWMQLPLKRQPLKKTLGASVRGHVWPSLLLLPRLLNKNKYHHFVSPGSCAVTVIRACEQSGSIGVGISLRTIWKMSSCAFREVLEPCMVPKA